MHPPPPPPMYPGGGGYPYPPRQNHPGAPHHPHHQAPHHGPPLPQHVPPHLAHHHGGGPPPLPPHHAPNHQHGAYYPPPPPHHHQHPQYPPPLYPPHPQHHHHHHPHDPHMGMNGPPPLPGYHPMQGPPGYPPLPPPGETHQRPPMPVDRPQAFHHPPHMVDPQYARPMPPPPQPQPSIPPMSYICRKCNLGGHWIQDCLKKPNQSKPPAKGGAPAAAGQFQCEPCEKQFSMKSQFDAHVLTHEQCWAPECEFKASKRVVTCHYQTAHGQYAGSGLKEIEIEGQTFKVLVGNSPEDIRKWREERRKKWPSDANVKRKVDERDERTQAGDVMSNPAKPKRVKLAHDAAKDGASTSETTAPLEAPSATEGGTPAPPTSTDAPSTLATGSPNQKPKKKSSKFCVKFIRSSCTLGVNCDYNHDVQSVPCKGYSSTGKCKRGDKCQFSHAATVPPKPSAAKSAATQVKEHKSSLLRKLLAKDIDREHRHMLQAFHHLVEHNFFQPTAPPLAAVVAANTDGTPIADDDSI
ncbi:Aste57867_13481 [Aphanomyces stellatus]|uniref:Aste57867_13481 protein n=1 Tax=Aphanomyces stellatus TaxID=120398 RepID=A0A485KYZ5_9STRA|nr:hypothetical protein As57867_013431 [Aphanomyces stellatus]VFT90319.1 Aste57867_13481 [Aphanomyces stellatus]